MENITQNVEQIPVAKEVTEVNDTKLTNELVLEVLGKKQPVSNNTQNTSLNIDSETNNGDNNENKTLINQPQEVVNKNIVENISPIGNTSEDLEKQLLSKLDSNEDVVNMINSLKTEYAVMYEKKVKETDEKINRMKEELEKQKEKERLAGMTESERQKYQYELDVKRLNETVELYKQRTKELETQLKKRDNEKFISEKVTESPYIKDFVDKLSISTKEDYESKIVPILEQLKNFDNLKKQNSYGNKNMFSLYQSDVGSPDKNVVNNINKIKNNYLNQIIKK